MSDRDLAEEVINGIYLIYFDLDRKMMRKQMWQNVSTNTLWKKPYLTNTNNKSKKIDNHNVELDINLLNMYQQDLDELTLVNQQQFYVIRAAKIVVLDDGIKVFGKEFKPQVNQDVDCIYGINQCSVNLLAGKLTLNDIAEQNKLVQHVPRIKTIDEENDDEDDN